MNELAADIKEAMARVLFRTIVVLSLFLYLSCFINGVAARNTLRKNEYLLPNQFLQNGDAMLYMETSCNLVLYNGNKVVWATNTAGVAKHSCMAQLEENGNFAVYADNKRVWSSEYHGVAGEYILVLLDTGNIGVFRSCPAIWSPVIRKPEAAEVIDHDNNPIWATNYVKT